MTSNEFMYYAGDYTKLEKGNCWRAIHPVCMRYMMEKGNKQAEEAYLKLVETALKMNTAWNLTDDDKQRLRNCAKYFVFEVQKVFGRKIYEACAKKVRDMNEDEVEKVINDIGDMDRLFKQALTCVKGGFSNLISIYANLFIQNYLHEGQKEVCEMLAKLPSGLLNFVSDRLLDNWDYSLSVSNGKLVVLDYD